MFKNREDAAFGLAEKLIRYRLKNPLVLAIPRGAVPMAAIISEELLGEMDVVLVHKLSAPNQPELAIGSVDEKGHVYISRHAAMVGADEAYLKRESEKQVQLLKDRRALYTPVHAPVSPTHRIVIIVDDGIATGSSMIAALRAIQEERPERLVAATAVAPIESLQMIKTYADEVVCLTIPEEFYSVGQFFENFDQVSDDEVIRILKQTRSHDKEKNKPPGFTPKIQE